MTDLALRLRALADRLDHLTLNDYIPAAKELTEEMLRQRVEDIEETVDLITGVGDGWIRAAAGVWR